MQIVTISSKRQITLPKRMLDELDLKPKSKMIIVREKDTYRLKPIKRSIVDELGGSLKKFVDPSKLGKSIKEIDREDKKLYAEHLAKKFKLAK